MERKFRVLGNYCLLRSSAKEIVVCFRLHALTSLDRRRISYAREEKADQCSPARRRTSCFGFVQLPQVSRGAGGSGSLSHGHIFNETSSRRSLSLVSATKQQRPKFIVLVSTIIFLGPLDYHHLKS